MYMIVIILLLCIIIFNVYSIPTEVMDADSPNHIHSPNHTDGKVIRQETDQAHMTSSIV